ncbi:MAG TPA: SpoIIE family protein phosphatase [Acidobacteriaceae bacterium]|nr:SpoIIE family protein phosphatase [Acidobacteriaceae bacterium]
MDEAQSGSGDELVVGDLGRATVPLDGPWAFHLGDNPAWAAPGFDDSAWTRIETGRDWETQGFRNHTGFAWYRRHISFSGASTPADLSLLLSGVENAAEVYWNGRLAGSFGKLPPNPSWQNPFAVAAGDLYWPHVLPLREPLSSGAAAGPVAGVLAIRVWMAPYVAFSYQDSGGLQATPIAGSQQAVAGLATITHFQWLKSNLYQIVTASVAGVVALLALLAWLRNRSRWMLFWLALYTAHPVLLFPIVTAPWMLPFRWSYGLVAPLAGLQDVSLWFLLLYLLGLRENRRLVQWTTGVAVLCVTFNCLDGSLQLFNWTTWANRVFLTFDFVFTIPALAVQAYSVVLVLFAFRKRLDAARWFLAIAAMLADLDFALSNWFSLGQRWTHLTWYKPFITPLVTIGGNGFDPFTILNTLLLAAIIYAVWRYQADQTHHQALLDEEYRNAQELQQILVPQSLPLVPGYEVSSAYLPAQVVGGDFFQIIALSNDESLAIVGDVSGKGLKAAMTVSLIIGALRTLAEATSDPAEILTRLNRGLVGHVRGGFATCLVLRLSGDGGCLLAGAGHPAPFLNGHELDLPAALPLGVVDAAEYSSIPLSLAPGDRLALYTDGLVEARNGSGELLGFERTRTLFSGDLDAHAAVASAVDFGQDDDMTVLILTRHAANRERAWAPTVVASRATEA